MAFIKVETLNVTPPEGENLQQDGLKDVKREHDDDTPDGQHMTDGTAGFKFEDEEAIHDPNHIKSELKEEDDEDPLGTYTCAYCGITFAIKSYFKAHTRFCQAKFRSKLRVTEKIHNTTVELRKHKCSLCSYHTASRRNLINHSFTHSGERPFKCTLCSYGATQKGALQRHVQHKHTDNHKPYKCDTCEYACAYAGNLKKHKLTHSPVKLFVCKICEKSVSDLRRHKLLHLSERPIACDVCQKTFNRITQLKQHMYQHNGMEKPYKCPQCSYATVHANAMKRHEKIIHCDEKPFECNVCDYKSARPNDLKVHMYTHSKCKPFKCLECTYECVRPDQLRKHVSKKH